MINNSNKYWHFLKLLIRNPSRFFGSFAAYLPGNSISSRIVSSLTVQVEVVTIVRMNCIWFVVFPLACSKHEKDWKKSHYLRMVCLFLICQKSEELLHSWKLRASLWCQSLCSRNRKQTWITVTNYWAERLNHTPICWTRMFFQYEVYLRASRWLWRKALELLVSSAFLIKW